MELAEAACKEGTVEECVDVINDFMAGLPHFAPEVLAVALREHLETLLLALLEAKACTRTDVRKFVRELERDALQYDED